MPKVIGYEKTFYLDAVTKESNFPKIIMKIGNRNVEGRGIYGFFVTEEEFQKKSQRNIVLTGGMMFRYVFMKKMNPLNQ